MHKLDLILKKYKYNLRNLANDVIEGINPGLNDFLIKVHEKKDYIEIHYYIDNIRRRLNEIFFDEKDYVIDVLLSFLEIETNASASEIKKIIKLLEDNYENITKKMAQEASSNLIKAIKEKIKYEIEDYVTENFGPENLFVFNIEELIDNSYIYSVTFNPESLNDNKVKTVAILRKEKNEYKLIEYYGLYYVVCYEDDIKLRFGEYFLDLYKSNYDYVQSFDNKLFNEFFKLYNSFN